MNIDIQEPARILGVPAKDGAYWYYELGKAVPSVVQAGEYRGQRAIRRNDGTFQGWWRDGEFFVGPIDPPFATPDVLANPSDAAWKAAHENMRRTDGSVGIDGAGRYVPPEQTIE